LRISREQSMNFEDEAPGSQQGPNVAGSQDAIAPPPSADSFLVSNVGQPLTEEAPLPERLKTFLIGKPLSLEDQKIFHHLSLIAFLAWVGLGADGLSSSCYGPAETFHALGEHTFLAVFLALAMVATVLVISTCYSHIIEEFPSGGGGYLVASKLLGRRSGVVAGCALLVDYVLTITVSIAAAGDALFGLLDPQWSQFKLHGEIAAIGLLIVLNLRGVKESVKVLLPIFLVFLAMHIVLIGGTLLLNVGNLGEVGAGIADEVRTSVNDPEFGLLGMISLLLYAYSLGAGTYTGIEAVSNSMPVMREPRVATAKRTMRYMAISLALTAGGLILAYLLLGIRPSEGKTMNQLLSEGFAAELGLGGWPGTAFVMVTMISEGALLFVAAQAGFIDGPRILGNMAQDSWMPHWFANLSERLTTHNGIMLMGISAAAALLYTQGNVSALLIMYSINVFLTFSMSMLGMSRHWWQVRGAHPLWKQRLALFLLGATMCVTILGITIYEKFEVGGWLTLAITGTCIGLCFLIRREYTRVAHRLQRLDQTLGQLATPQASSNLADPDRQAPTAVILVGRYGGLGIHTMLNALRFAPNFYKNVVFVSIGVVDSGNFKGSAAIDDLKKSTEESLGRYVDVARQLGMLATSYMAMGIDVVDELERVCLAVVKQFPRATFFAGQLVFQQETWYQRLLHNQTAFALQRRLHFAGVTMVILPTRVK
jgi:amino acid transporter